MQQSGRRVIYELLCADCFLTGSAVLNRRDLKLVKGHVLNILYIIFSLYMYQKRAYAVLNHILM